MADFAADFPADLGADEGEFVRYQLAHAPPWLLGEWGERLMIVLGIAKEVQSQRTRDAVKARFVHLAPVDALPDLGKDRKMLRAPGETDDGYRERLLNAFDIWATAGTEAGLLELFRVAGATDVTIWEDQDVGGALGHWARFAIYVAEPHPYTAPKTWGSFAWGDGTCWGFGDDAAITYTKEVIRRWKPAHTRCVGIAVVWAGVDGLSIIRIDDGAAVAGAPPPDAITDPNFFPILGPDGVVITDGTAS